MHNWSEPGGLDSQQRLLSLIWTYNSRRHCLPVRSSDQQVRIQFPDPVPHRYMPLLFLPLLHPSTGIHSLQIHAHHRIPHIPILDSYLPVHNKPDSGITCRLPVHPYFSLHGYLFYPCYRMHILYLLLFFLLLFLYTEDFYFSADSSVL